MNNFIIYGKAKVLLLTTLWSFNATSGWNEPEILTTYRQGLQPALQLHLSIYDEYSMGLECFIQLSIWELFPPVNHQSLITNSEFMQTDAFQLSPAGCQRQLTHNCSCTVVRCIQSLRPLVSYVTSPNVSSSPFNYLVLENFSSDLILGCPWLIHHSPIISWSTRDNPKWGSQCFF